MSLAQNQRVCALHAASEATFDELIALSELGSDEGPSKLADALNGKGALLLESARLTEATALLERARDQLELSGDDASQLLDATYNNLGGAYYRANRLADSAAAYERSIAIREARGDLDSPDAVYVLSNLAVLYMSLGRLEDAQRETELCLNMVERHFDPGHVLVPAMHKQLAQVLGMRGADPELVAEHYSRGLERRRALFGPDHALVGQDQASFGIHLAKHGRFEEARARLDDAIRIRSALAGSEGEGLDKLLAARAQVDLDAGAPDGGTVAALERAVSIAESRERPAPEDVAVLLELLARAADEIGDEPRAQEARRRLGQLGSAGR
jgi:tetratricopeptide (TPR) repeat protein